MRQSSNSNEGREEMNCFMCKGGRLENRDATFMTEIDKCAVIVRNTPSQVCAQCGEVSYSDAVASRLEQIVNSVRGAIAEIAVINYADKAA
jgi:YgiT-type zinc finger domain-containing protein